MKTLGKVIYIGVLPAMGTTLLLLALFMQEISMVTTNETFLKVFALTMCATTWFAAFQYWNSFVREFSVQMTEPEINEYKEYEESYDEGYTKEYDEDYGENGCSIRISFEKVEFDSPIKGLCRPFILEHSTHWMKDSRGSWGNGYVLISSDHPWSGKEADYLEHTSMQEITFSGVFGKAGLEEAGFEKEIYENADKYWVFGFDTMHSYNSSTNDKDWVGAEAIKLASDFKKEYVEEVI